MPEQDDSAAVLAEANAKAAELAAEKAELELNEWKSPAAVANRAAQQNVSTAQAEKSLMDASFGQFSGAVPDLSKINAGATTVDAGTQLFGSALALQALGQASREAAADIAGRITDKSKCLLVTTETDLASTDAVYAQVKAGLEQLLAAAQTLTAPAAAPTALETTGEDAKIHFEIVPAVIGAAAMLLPGIVSLLSANRKLSGASVSADDVQAVIGVTAGLVESQLKVLIDDFRTIEATGPISDLLGRVNEQRLALATRKNVLTSSTRPEDAATLALVGQVAAAIDAFLTSIMAIPSGATRSAYTSAMLRERLHDGTIPCMVLIKGVGGSTAQVVNDKPLWFKDKFTTIASAGLSWLLLDTADGTIIAGGSKVSTLEITGTIGASMKVNSATTIPV